MDVCTARDWGCGGLASGGQCHHNVLVAGSNDATERGRKVTEALLRKGRELGFEAVAEYPVQGGRLDVVWLLRLVVTIPGVDEALPVAGFEIESSWRTRKHIKGDYLNLADLGAALGVIVLLGDGEDVDATRRFASILVDRPGPRVLVWSERDVDMLMQEATVSPRTPGPSAPTASQRSAQGEHAGKYRALWAWLHSLPGDRAPATFAQIEEIIGMPLPRSCRQHAAHWSSYEGSAVARAIHDAGWVAREVSIPAEHLVFQRRQ